MSDYPTSRSDGVHSIGLLIRVLPQLGGEKTWVFIRQRWSDKNTIITEIAGFWETLVTEVRTFSLCYIHLMELQYQIAGVLP